MPTTMYLCNVYANTHWYVYIHMDLKSNNNYNYVIS